MVSASATTITPSSARSGNNESDCTIDAGSATPLVSISRWSIASRRSFSSHQRREQVAAKTAADAAAGNADQIAVARLDQIGIDRQFAELVDQHREAAAVGVAQEMIDQRGLAGAEIAADQRDRDRAAHIASAAKTRPPCTVPQIRTSPSLSPPISVGSSSSTAKSARLAAFDRADLAVEAERVGRAERDGAQRVGHRNPLFRCQARGRSRFAD